MSSNAKDELPAYTEKKKNDIKLCIKYYLKLLQPKTTPTMFLPIS